MRIREKRVLCNICNKPASPHYYVYKVSCNGKKFAICEDCLSKVKSKDCECIFCGKTGVLRTCYLRAIVLQEKFKETGRTIKDQKFSEELPICDDCFSKLEVRKIKASIVICDGCGIENPDNKPVYFRWRGGNTKIGDFCEDCLKASEKGRCLTCGEQGAHVVKLYVKDSEYIRREGGGSCIVHFCDKCFEAHPYLKYKAVEVSR